MAHHSVSAGQDVEDELIPEPVYFRLGDRMMDVIENQILGDEEEEEQSDSEMEVTDLTAPPSQAYVHPLTLCMSYPCTRATEVSEVSGAGVTFCVGGFTDASAGRRRLHGSGVLGCRTVT